jgi:cytochrome c oxidase assembly protein subunit 11
VASRDVRVAGGLVTVVVTMVGLSFAAVPFYDWFCRVTGYGGTTTTAVAPEGPARAETVTVRFDANNEPDAPWEFRPQERTMQVHVGESALAFYEFYNPTDEVMAGTASYNVTPHPAGPYFAKIACFCFELQVLQPGERVVMPVSFFVDEAMLEDRDASGTRVITLSYTMYRADLPLEQAALDVDTSSAGVAGAAAN